ncbi:MAG: YfiR family protein [Ramlibacter sp.]
MQREQAHLTAATRLGWLAACLLVVLLVAVPDRARGQAASSESAVKAAYLYKFTGFVEWPPGTFERGDQPLQIGVMGDDAVAADLEQIVAGRAFDGHPIAVRRLRDGAEPAGLHVLLIGPGREGRVRDVIAATPGPVLVVTEQDDGLRLGAVLNFLGDGGKVHFAASLPAAEARGLRLSARLLAVAQSVEGRPR